MLTEYLAGVLPILHAISSNPLVIALSTVVVLAAIGVLYHARARLEAGERRFLALLGIYVAGLSTFYGLYFGAAWFLPRYFLPISPFFMLLTVSGIVWLIERAGALGPKLAPLAAIALVAAMSFVSLRQYRQGHQHAHFQVVAWVQENVPADVWVGAIQTGTLGFFHDRTVNLDGKVNIAAYEALVADREDQYVVHDTEIQYLADWVGMRDWLTLPAIAEHFELIVEDEAANLTVLRRRTTTERATERATER